MCMLYDMLLCFQYFSPSYQSTTTLNANGHLLLMQRVRQFVWSSSFHRAPHIGIHRASSLYTPKTLRDSLPVPSAQMLITAGAGTSERGLLFSMQMEAVPLDGTAVLRRKSLPVQPEWNRKAFCFHLITADQLNMTCSWWVTSYQHSLSEPSRDWMGVWGLLFLLRIIAGGKLEVFQSFHCLTM